MNLYHRSLVVVENPQILPRENGKTCDFGIGFYTTINLYESGLLSVESTLRELKTYKLADQILFHTEKSLTFLKYISSEKTV